ncbi:MULTISPECIES: hypothetical protein [unclassified Rhodococcus (in: high G+C Gram-positive bacteria)]|uniref:hypothetical protein n=1 Tax=unclassified Rhodococcus (in: high G+C Gram-positive bacteria) TaxID=192944 RepID=UPI00163B3854|nr:MULTISPECIES: hypothetical protein [unclassified Rhodococcus (in: high G+C Gram-positive bacteria)]MBC2644676.1 hypothetical protein [Rhodococcus sp. 3A]MBC2898275.1 hypothetical protein [Rhodococcus sp. 4CII]
MTIAAPIDVVWAAYTTAVGIPDVAGAPDTRAARCARCGLTTAVMSPGGQVVSRRFTGYESWTNLAGRRLCEVCVWGYRHRSLRTGAHIVTRGPVTLTPANPALLHQVLSTTIDPDTAVIVPLRPGRKHLLPDARWGTVTADDAQLSWTSADAHRLAVMRRLRGHGFTETMLGDDAPSYPVLSRVAADQWPQVFDDWNHLALWRQARPWFEVGLRATRI